MVRNDGATWAELAGGDFDNIVISPGPGTPSRAQGLRRLRRRDPRVGGAAAGRLPRPPGHRPLHGRQVVHAPEVMHGRLSAVYHDDSPLFAGIPQGFQVVRYHSLCVPEPLPEELEGTAWTSDGVLMGVAHRSRPLWGVQFHPESIETEWGRHLLANFRDLTLAHAGRRTAPMPAQQAKRQWSPPQRPTAAPAQPSASTASTTPSRPSSTSTATTARLLARQQQGRRALALLVHGRQRRAALRRWSTTTSPRAR